jgi:hypothetical protein
MGCKKLNPSGFEKYRRSRIGDDAVVIFGAPIWNANVYVLFEIAVVRVRLNHVASRVINANHGIIFRPRVTRVRARKVATKRLS